MDSSVSWQMVALALIAAIPAIIGAVAAFRAAEAAREAKVAVVTLDAKTERVAADTSGKLVDLHNQGNSNWDKAAMALARANEEIATLRGTVAGLEAGGWNTPAMSSTPDPAAARRATEAAAADLEVGTAARDAAQKVVAEAAEVAKALKAEGEGPE